MFTNIGLLVSDANKKHIFMKMCYLQKKSSWKINWAIWKAGSDSYDEIIRKIKSFDSDLRTTAKAKDLSAVTVAQAQLEIDN